MSIRMPYALCVGCGYCCTKAPCAIAQRRYGYSWTSPCPELLADDGRFWCRIIANAKGQNKRDLMKELAIGIGCTSSLNTWRRQLIGNRHADAKKPT